MDNNSLFWQWGVGRCSISIIYSQLFMSGVNDSLVTSSSANNLHPSLNLLQRFLRNKNKYRQKYFAYLSQSPKTEYPNKVQQKPKTSNFTHRRWQTRQFSSSDNLQKILKQGHLKRRTHIQLQQDSFGSQDFKSFILSERQKLKNGKIRRQKKTEENVVSIKDNKTIERQPFKKNTKISIVNVTSVVPPKEEPSFISSSKQNTEGTNRMSKFESVERWKHYKKKRYINSQIFSVKKFILSTAYQREIQPRQKPARNLSQIFLNRMKSDGCVEMTMENRHQETEMIQIDPWDYDMQES